jgi:hypothetical protein
MKSKSILYIIFSKRGFDTLRLPDVLTILFYPHSWLIYNRVFNKSNTTGVTCGWGSPYPSGAPEFTPAFSGVRVTRSLVFCVVFCRSLFVLFLLTIVLSVLRITASDYPFGVFKPQGLVSFKTYMPSLLPYSKVNIYPFPLPHSSIFSPYLWSFRWPNYIVTLPRYFSFRLPHLNISTGPPSDKLDKNSQRMWLINILVNETDTTSACASNFCFEMIIFYFLSLVLKYYWFPVSIIDLQKYKFEL